jgi:hypothetical protein
MELLVQLCPDNLGLNVGDSLFTDIDYADDAALLTLDPRNWSNVLNCYEIAANTVGLHTNWSKTKIQNIGAGPSPDPLLMYNQQVAPVTKFTYLGSDVDSDGYSTPEIHRRLGMANSVMGQLDVVWKQKRLSLQTRLRLYSALILSILLYGSETWTQRKSDSDRLQAFHMMAQRRILGIRWSDHVTNISIQKSTGLTNLPIIIADRRHALFGHICRLSPEAPPHRALLLCMKVLSGDRPAPDWRRPRGRPRRMWLHQVEEDYGSPVSAAYVAAQDRSSWRSLRPSAGQARQ